MQLDIEALGPWMEVAIKAPELCSLCLGTNIVI